MQSRLATKLPKRSNWLSLFAGAGDRPQPLLRQVAYASTPTDPDDTIHVHSQEKTDAAHKARPQKVNKETDDRKSLHRTYPTVDSTEVSPQPVDPIAQQKRRQSTAVTQVSCAGVDGTPWPDETQVDDNKEYFKHRKASPLSEIEVADTRKLLLTRAAVGLGGAPPEVEMESADETLERASRMWKERAMRGDPDFPPSKLLRAYLGHHNF